jgi:hypothetical protein
MPHQVVAESMAVGLVRDVSRHHTQRWLDGRVSRLEQGIGEHASIESLLRYIGTQKILGDRHNNA